MTLQKYFVVTVYTSSTQHEIIAHRNDTMWSLGVTSLNALSIFLKLREKGFLIGNFIIRIILFNDNIAQIILELRGENWNNFDC